MPGAAHSLLHYLVIIDYSWKPSLSFHPETAISSFALCSDARPAPPKIVFQRKTIAFEVPVRGLIEKVDEFFRGMLWIAKNRRSGV